MAQHPRYVLLIVYAATLLVGFGGCARNILVYRDGDKSPIQGLPFYAKEAVLVQETKIARFAYKVQIQITHAKGADKETLQIPETGALVVAQNTDSEATLVRAASDLDTLARRTPGTADKDFVASQAAEILVPVAKLLPDDPVASNSYVIENKWTVDTRVGPTRYYIVTKQPWFGSASNTFEFKDDGTLGHAESNVENQTASTLLSLLPINTFLTHQWTHSAPGAASTAVGGGDDGGDKSGLLKFGVGVTRQDVEDTFNTAEKKAGRPLTPAQMQKILDGFAATQPKPAPKPKESYELHLLKTPDLVVYTLQKISPASMASTAAGMKPLTDACTNDVQGESSPSTISKDPLKFADTKTDCSGVQLVSISTLSDELAAKALALKASKDDADASDKKDDKPADGKDGKKKADKK